MKIITKETYLEQEIFALMHLFIQTSENDENKPFVYFDMNLDGVNLSVSFKIEFEDDVIDYQNNITLKPYKDELTQKRYVKRAVKNELYKILSKKFNRELPWGSLTGIRPTKVAYELLESGVDKYFIKEALMKDYNVSESKALLVAQTIKNQTCIIKNDNLVDLYINIPFCPTKC